MTASEVLERSVALFAMRAMGGGLETCGWPALIRIDPHPAGREAVTVVDCSETGRRVTVVRPGGTVSRVSCRELEATTL